MKQRNVITAAITVAGLVVATGASAVSAPAVQATAARAAQGPAIKLIAAQHTITAQRFGNQVFVDPGIWVASLGAPLRLDGCATHSLGSHIWAGYDGSLVVLIATR